MKIYIDQHVAVELFIFLQYRWHDTCKEDFDAHHDGVRMKNKKPPGNPKNTMKTEMIVRMIVGTLILSSAALSHWNNPNWIWLTAFVGLNLLQSSITGFCPSEHVIRKLRGETTTQKKSYAS